MIKKQHHDKPLFLTKLIK